LCSRNFPLHPELGSFSGWRLLRPHTEVITMTRTGTLQPTSCGKRPNAVGQSVMTLPGKPTQDAVRLSGKGTDLWRWWQSHRSSLSAGKPRTWRRVIVQGAVMIWPTRGITLMIGRPAGTVQSVYKDSLGVKAGCGESRLSGLGGGFSKPLKGNFEYGD
jgi:hypothetical protein